MKIEVSNNQRPDIQMHRIDDAAAISRLSRGTIYNRIKDGSLRSVKVGKRRLIPETALRQLLQVEEAR